MPRAYIFDMFRFYRLTCVVAYFVSCSHGRIVINRPLPGGTYSSVLKRKAVELLLSQKTCAPEPLSYIDDHKYIQHNVGAPDGKTGFIPIQKMLCEDPTTFINPLRVFQDGDYVFTHTDNDPSVAFDVFRFEDGLIVEHWDNWQEKAAKPNGAGHTMLDGPTQAKDLDKTAANKALLTSYVNNVVVKGNRASALAYFNNAQYIQHNPLATGDGLAATAGLVASLPPGTNVCSRVRQVLGEGDFVLVMCDGTWGTNATAFYDLYRVENGKIAEHWDTIEQIPPCSQWGNMNGKF